MTEPAGPAPRARILVVDDDEMIVRMLRDILAADHDVLTASSGKQGQSLLERERLDAVVTDQMMPGVTGLELLREAIERQPDAVRILVTASDRIEDARDAINTARVSRFLTKPFRVLEVLEAVRGSLRERAYEQENRRLIGQLGERNRQLERALSEIQHQERRLEAVVLARTEELRRAVGVLEQLALRDPLTGLYNHRYFQEALSAEVARAARHGRKLSLLFLDVDLFKAYNDAHGHPAGDELLRNLARILTGTGDAPEIPIRGRASDVAARYGGEEFVVILPETEKDGAAVRAERLRAAVEAYPFPGREMHPSGRITVSIGVASYPEHAVSRQGLIEAADQALFRAKREGRNRVMIAP